jgi:hypothetical protein
MNMPTPAGVVEPIEEIYYRLLEVLRSRLKLILGFEGDDWGSTIANSVLGRENSVGNGTWRSKNCWGSSPAHINLANSAKIAC